jgi:NADH-quinone oxidoreductase subunit D
VSAPVDTLPTAEQAPPRNYEVVPKTAPDGTPLDGDLLEVAMGPQHPSTHGVFRMDVTLDGETVVKLKPVFGYLHRNHEKIAENTTYLGSMPYTDRLDYFCSLTNNWAYALSVEKLAGLQVPERAEYIRVITGEMTRLLNHTCAIGFLMQDMGALGTPLMYAFREREKILDLIEALTGARMMCNYMRFGGCRVDLPGGWIEGAKQVVANYPRFLDEFEALLSGNEILMARTQGVGKLSAELAINASITGPMLRASGVDYDLRKVDKYGIYDRFPFRVPLGDHGDVYDRYMIRILEMRESVKILQQALPPGQSLIRRRSCAVSSPRPARRMAALNPPRANSASTSSATAARIRIATASALRASSTLRSSKTCASAGMWPTSS